MSRNCCGHCGKGGHNRKRCPEINRPKEELDAERQAEWKAYVTGANEAAKILGRFAPEERIRVALEAFRRASHDFSWPAMTALFDREEKAVGQLESMLKTPAPGEKPKLRIVRH